MPIAKAPPPGILFDVQRFSLHDGPGIRTTLFFKGCPLRCAWCQNPEGLSRTIELSFFSERCGSLGDCFAACPRGALTGGGPRIVRTECDGCGVCVSECARGAYKLVGRRVSLDELWPEVERDRAFFEASGGGLTLSGGEPTLQMEFAASVIQRCAEMDIRVGLQTCGAFSFEAFSPLIPKLQFIHFDLKILDPALHLALVGADNRTILANARKLVSAGAPVIFRMPVIPDHTDSPENIEQVAALLKELNLTQLALLPYHRMGEVKLPRLGYPIPPLGIGDPSRGRAAFAQTQELLKEHGITTS